MTEKYIFDSEDEENEEARPLEKELRERLRSVRSASERRTIAGLAREIGKLPTDVALAAFEVGKGLASVSLRAGVDFLRVVPEAARVLDAEELRAWGEMGRRLVGADVETDTAFLSSGASELESVPRAARLALLQVCSRQLSLSTSTALETYRAAPEVARAVGDAERLRRVFEVAYEISRRSARHGADFVNATIPAAARLNAFDSKTVESVAVENRVGDEASADVWDAALSMAQVFASRVGGLAADMWAAMPGAIEGLKATDVLRLFRQSEGCLHRGVF